jgi:hypothetical protein
MEQRITWEADSLSTDEDIPRLLRNLKVHRPVQKKPPLIPVMRQMREQNPVHSLKSSIF